jgi:hypothetical protein
MNASAAIIFANLLWRLGYQMARTPVLPIFTADLGTMPELIGVTVAASTITGIFFKLPSAAGPMIAELSYAGPFDVLAAVIAAAAIGVAALVRDSRATAD